MRGWHIFSTPQRKFLKELSSNPRSTKQICKTLNQDIGRVARWMEMNPKFRDAVNAVPVLLEETVGALDQKVLRTQTTGLKLDQMISSECSDRRFETIVEVCKEAERKSPDVCAETGVLPDPIHPDVPPEEAEHLTRVLRGEIPPDEE